KINSHLGAGRPRLAGHRKRVGELGDDDFALQLEILAVQWHAAHDDRLAMARADAHEAAVIGYVQRDPNRGHRFQYWYVGAGRGKEKTPGFFFIAAPDRRVWWQLQTE